MKTTRCLLCLAFCSFMICMNARAREKVVFVRYNSGDYLEFESRVSRGWPFSAARLDEAGWGWHPVRMTIDLLVFCVLCNILHSQSVRAERWLRVVIEDLRQQCA